MVNGPYYCPQCRKELLQILADPTKKEVFAICKCGIEEKMTYAPVFQPIDYYSKFMDMYKKRRLQELQRQYQLRQQQKQNSKS